MEKPFPTIKMRLAIAIYAVLMFFLLPVLLLYIFIRARKDRRYGQHLGERFGFYKSGFKSCVWVYAVSLGELRAAAPLITELLARGEHIVTTHFTPAGRDAAIEMFAEAHANGTLKTVYIPLEFDWAYRRFFKAFSPKYGLVVEIDLWPRMIASANRHGVPLFLCNGDYPAQSFARDQRKFGLRAELVTGFSGVFAKTEAVAERFVRLGARNVSVAGELRFDQPVPAQLIDKAQQVKPHYESRMALTFASVVEGEDAQYIAAIKAVKAHFEARGKPPPLFIYVPRAPERFDPVADMLTDAGFSLIKRSEGFDAALNPAAPHELGEIDILLGNSFGEMYFYLELAQIVIVGGGFIPAGAHNVIEPLALQKTVLVGPQIWTIAYPAEEAIAAGTLTSVATIPELVQEIIAADDPEIRAKKAKAAAQFYHTHTGCTQRTLAAIDALIGKA